MRHQRDQEQNQEDKEQNLRNPRGRNRNSPEPEKPGKDRNQKERQSPIEHFRLSLPLPQQSEGHLGFGALTARLEITCPVAAFVRSLWSRLSNVFYSETVVLQTPEMAGHRPAPLLSGSPVGQVCDLPLQRSLPFNPAPPGARLSHDRRKRLDRLFRDRHVPHGGRGAKVHFAVVRQGLCARVAA